MINRLELILKKYNMITEELSSPTISSDIKKLAELSKEQVKLKNIVDTYNEYKKVLNDIEEAKEMVKDQELGEFAKEELVTLEEQKQSLTDKLEILLLPQDPNDDKNVIVEIRGAAGGDEANIFAGDLFDMYQKYISNFGWKIDILNEPSFYVTYLQIYSANRELNLSLGELPQ